MSIKPENINFIILPGKCPTAEYLEKHNQAYNCWREVWTGFQKDMKDEEVLHSDTFTKQDEIMAIFYQNECAALIFCREVDFNEDATIHDSYFETWPEIAIHKLCSEGKKVLVFSQFTLKPKFRKHFLGMSWKDLLVGLCYERFSRSSCNAGATSARIKKHMEEAVYKVNGTPLIKNIHYRYDQTVDLIGFFHDKVSPSTVPGIAELARTIYLNGVSLVKSVEVPMKKEKIKLMKVA